MLIRLYELKNIWYGLVVAIAIDVTGGGGGGGCIPVCECRALGVLDALKLSRSTLVLSYSIPLFSSCSLDLCQFVYVCTFLSVRVCVCVYMDFILTVSPLY